VGSLQTSAGEPPTALRRIHIAGGAGSGKSTLAGRLSTCLLEPVYHLDALNFVRGQQPKPVEEREAALQRVLAQPEWITDGIYLGWTDALLEAADSIIWLDLPWYVALPRIVGRYIRASLSGTNEYRGVRRLMRFLGWSAAYYRPMTPAQIDALSEDSTHSRAATARHLGPYKAKLMRFRSAAQVDAFLATLEQAGVCRPRSASRVQEAETVTPPDAT
jgi:adenylate kinase family enzyme